MSASRPMTPAEVEAELRLRPDAAFVGPLMQKAADALAAQAVELERMREALKVAEHDLVTTDNLRATDLSPVQMNEALNRGVALSDLEWMTDNSRGLAAIRQALSVKAG